ncbi:MAG: ribosome small subunit-dependent GTPase A [Bacteroidales bacterium]|nr:ribosome small subunit-dependent GTPase A [Bacteroidales bacterium]
MQGQIIKNTGSWYVVRTDDNQLINCKVKGNFRIKGIRTTNPVAVGDIVNLILTPDGTGFINAIQTRKNYIIRRASNLSKESHILAANIDCAFLVVSLRQPTTTTTFIDRFLATAEAYNIPATLVFNKCDTWDDDDKELAEAMTYLYESIGYNVIHTSATENIGIDILIAAAKDKVSLFAGNSGVGKSSLINALIPGINLKVGEISDMHQTGTHTTTFSEMHQLPEGGQLIDIPGVKGFGTIDFDSAEVSHYFPEIFRISKDCKYNNCTHTHEPGCAVLQALDEQLISQSRYTSYLSIMEDSNPDKYRKPF